MFLHSLPSARSPYPLRSRVPLSSAGHRPLGHEIRLRNKNRTYPSRPGGDLHRGFLLRVARLHRHLPRRPPHRQVLCPGPRGHRTSRPPVLIPWIRRPTPSSPRPVTGGAWGAITQLTLIQSPQPAQRSHPTLPVQRQHHSPDFTSRWLRHVRLHLHRGHRTSSSGCHHRLLR